MLNFITEIFSNYPWLIVLIKVLGVFAVIMPMVAYSVMAERRISALIQDRIGPNRVGIPFTKVKILGLGQPLADGLKSFLKEDFTPAYVKRIFFWMAPAVSMIPSFVVFAVIPFGSFLGAQKMVIADLNVGILFTFGNCVAGGLWNRFGWICIQFKVPVFRWYSFECSDDIL